VRLSRRDSVRGQFAVQSDVAFRLALRFATVQVTDARSVAGSGVWTHPRVGSQVSTVHASPSSHEPVQGTVLDVVVLGTVVLTELVEDEVVATVDVDEEDEELLVELVVFDDDVVALEEVVVGAIDVEDDELDVVVLDGVDDEVVEELVAVDDVAVEDVDELDVEEGGAVDVLELLEEVEDELLDEVDELEEVELPGAEDVVEELEVVDEVLEEVVVGASVLVDVELVDDVVVVAPLGGTTRSPNAPLFPLKPSTVMKYVCPAVTVGVIREPCDGLPDSPVVQPDVSSLHATSVPVPHVALLRYTTVSYSVAAPHVSIVAWPDTAGVHWKTFSGDALVVELQLPDCVLVPLVVPVAVPPPAGRIVAWSQAFPNAAVYVVSVSGVLMVCVWAPPSDQLWNVTRLVGPIWGEGAPSVRVMPATPVIARGVARGCPSSVMPSPDGLVRNVMSACTGQMKTVALPVSCVESVAVSVISYQMSGSVSPPEVMGRVFGAPTRSSI